MLDVKIQDLLDNVKYAQSQLQNINTNPLGRRRDDKSRAGKLSFLLKNIIAADKLDRLIDAA